MVNKRKRNGDGRRAVRQDRLFVYVLLLLVAIPALYYLLWGLLVGPLNEAFGVETSPT